MRQALARTARGCPGGGPLLKAVLAGGVVALASVPARAQLDLSTYTLAQTINLPPVLTEASAVAYDWDTNRIYLIPDNTAAVVEMTLGGVVVSQMALSGFEDVEGLTYLGSGRFAISEERLQDVFRFTFVGGGTVVRSTLPGVSLGATTNNDGIEGLSFEPLTGYTFAVKEKTPPRVMRTVINWKAPSVTIVDLFDPALLGVLDLADIAVLSTVPSLVGTPDQDNLLIISQASARLVECTRTGVVKSTLNLSALSTTAEGVAIDPQRTIYICDESPKLFIFKPPACYPNCDQSTGNPVLTSNDFQCFINNFAAGAASANCDGSTGTPTLTANDFQCFVDQFASGCP